MENLIKSNGFKDFEKIFINYCKYNNFKLEEIQYLMTMMNTFVYLNKPTM